jgi:uncharacterized protein (TIGR00369 family)
MSSALSAPGERVRSLWRRLSGKSGGKAVFSFLFGRMAPYTGTLGARVEALEPGFCRVSLRDRRRVRNHLDSIHAMALANLAEAASGLAVVASLAPGVQGIVTVFTIAYLKKARGRLVAECRVNVAAVTEEREQPAEITIADSAGDVVARATATWRLRPPPSAPHLLTA